MHSASNIMSLWKAGLISSEQVISWADEQILAVEVPDLALIDLSTKGPYHCSRMSFQAFPVKINPVPFEIEFGIRACILDLESPTSLLRFVKWFSRACISENLDLPEVALGYQIDHYLNDCDNAELAVETLKAELLPLLPKCRQILAQIIEELPNLSFNNAGFAGSDPTACSGWSG